MCECFFCNKIVLTHLTHTHTKTIGFIGAIGRLGIHTSCYTEQNVAHITFDSNLPTRQQMCGILSFFCLPLRVLTHQCTAHNKVIEISLIIMTFVDLIEISSNSSRLNSIQCNGAIPYQRKSDKKDSSEILNMQMCIHIKRHTSKQSTSETKRTKTHMNISNAIFRLKMFSD